MVVKWNIVLFIAHLCALCTGFESSYQIRQDGKGWLQYSYSPELEGFVKLHTEPADWHSARVRCHMEGAFLASPWFPKFAALISKMQNGKSQLTMVYSGVHKTFAEGALTDVEGVLGISSHPSDLTKLERCGVFLADGSTGEVGCEELLPFVCYRPASNPGLDTFTKSEIETETATGTETVTDYLSPSTTEVNIRNIEYPSTTDSEIREYKTYISTLPTESENETDYSFSTTEEYFNFMIEFTTPRDNSDIEEFEKYLSTLPTESETETDYSFSTTEVNIPFTIEYPTTTSEILTESETETDYSFSTTEEYIVDSTTASESETEYIFSTIDDYVTTKAELESESITKTSAVALSETPDCGKANSGYKFSENTKHCYKFHTQAVHTWHDAKAACEEEGAYLAIVNSAVEADVLKKLFELYPAEKIQGASDTEAVAIGYSKNERNQNWVTISGQTLEEAGYDSWRRDCPHPYATLGFFFRDGLLYGYVPGVRDIAFICEKIPSQSKQKQPTIEQEYNLGTTESSHEFELSSSLLLTSVCGKFSLGYKFSMHTGHCYKFHTQAVYTWYKAKRACEEEGGYLAIINSDVEAQVLKELFAKYPADKIQGAQFTETAAIGYLKEYPYKWVTINGDSIEKAGYSTWRRDAPHPWASLGFFGRDGLLYGYVQAIRDVAFICEKDTFNVQDLVISTEKPVLTTQKELRNTPKYIRNKDYF